MGYTKDNTAQKIWIATSPSLHVALQSIVFKNQIINKFRTGRFQKACWKQTIDNRREVNRSNPEAPQKATRWYLRHYAETWRYSVCAPHLGSCHINGNLYPYINSFSKDIQYQSLCPCFFLCVCLGSLTWKNTTPIQVFQHSIPFDVTSGTQFYTVSLPTSQGKRNN